MSTTYYNTVDGSILGQTTSGVRTDYMTDAVGSVTGTTVSGNVENMYRYMPFGTLLAKTGTSSDPSFLWEGTQGYRATQRSYSDYYVRLRHLAIQSSSWTSLDKYWPDELGWGYASYNPIVSADPTGALTTQPVNSNSWEVWCCGGFQSYIKWADVPPQAGWIIQKLVWPLSYFIGCPPSGQLVTESPVLEYFEAWQVTESGGVLVCPWLYNSNYDDIWSFDTLLIKGTSDSLTRSLVGSTSMTGTAIFVPGTPTGFSVFKPGTVGAAGCLYAASKWDEWNYYFDKATTAGQVATQSATYDWNCCCSCTTTGKPIPCTVKFRRNPSYEYGFTNSCGCNPNTCVQE